MSLLTNAVKLADRDPAATAALAILDLHSTSGTQLILQGLAASLLERCLIHSKMQADGSALLTQTANMDFAVSWLKSVTKVLPSKGKTGDVVLEFRIRDLENACIGELQPKRAAEMPGNPFGDLGEPVAAATVSFPVTRVFRSLPKEMQKEFSRFLSSQHSKFSVIGVSERDSSRSARRR